MKKVVLLLPMLFILVSCAKTMDTMDTASLWSQAKVHGENKVFFTKVGGNVQKVVWVSATGSPMHIPHKMAHQNGMQLLGNKAYDIDTKIIHQSDGKCRIEMLMTTR